MKLTDKEQREEVYEKIWLPLQKQFKVNANEEEIERCAKYLADIAVKVWPR